MSRKPLALVAVTRQGVHQMRRLHSYWPETSLWIPAKWGEMVPEASQWSPPLQRLVEDLWSTHGRIVMGLSVGATVRLIAPFLTDKFHDPAVVAIDETSRFVVPILSAHFGGANQLARDVAQHLGATPIITTASDAMGCEALDTRLARMGYRVENPRQLSRVMTDVLDGQPVSVSFDLELKEWAMRLLDGNKSPLVLINGRGALHLSVRRVAPNEAVSTVIVRPPALVVGIGCVRGVSSQDVHSAVSMALNQWGLSRYAIGQAATIDLKADEDGLRQWAKATGIGLQFFSATDLNQVPGDRSEVVHQATGAWAVSRPAAILAAQGGSVLGQKFKTALVTVTVALKSGPDKLDN